MNPCRRHIITGVLLCLFGLHGCGDDTVIAVGGGPPPSSTAPDPWDPEAIAPEDVTREIVLLHDTTQPISLYPEEQIELRAKVIDYTAGGPAANVLVSFAITDNPEGGDANLTAGQAYTDDTGIATVVFRANSTEDAPYVVGAAAEYALPVSLPIDVHARPRGNLQVSLAYEGPINVKNVHVRLLPGSFTCAQFNPVNVPSDVLGDKVVAGLGLGNDVVWADLLASEKYTVLATAESPTGSLAAAACLDGVVVVGDAQNDVTLTLYLLTLNPAGTYDATTVFDFTGAVPGEMGELIDAIVLLFNDPGAFLIDQVKNLVAGYIGDLFADAAFSLFEDQLADIITDWLLTESPDWVQDIFTIGQDLTQVVNSLELESTLVISKLSNDYYVQGVLWWTGIVLYWHYGCPDEGEPDYDPECGKNVFSLEEFSNTQFPMDIIEGKFTGMIQSFDRLDIDNHTIKISYGKLILFVLNEMLLPALTGEDNLTDAILSFVNCGAIANSFVGDILDLLGVNPSTLEGFCIDAITFLVQPVEMILGTLALDSQLRLSGTATLVDVDNDLVVDQIIDGVFLGHIEVDGQQGPAFDGAWEAVRAEP